MRRSSRNGLLAVRLGGKGDVTATHVLWRYGKSLPDVPAPLLYRNVLFLVKSGGIATSLDPASGKVLKLARLTGALEDYYAPPVGADGKVYLLRNTSKTAPSAEDTDREFVGCLPLRNAAFALLWNSRKTEPVRAARSRVPFLYGGAVRALCAFSQGGKVVVLTAPAEWEVLRINDMEEELCATPAIVEGGLYPRTVSSLSCFKKTLHK